MRRVVAHDSTNDNISGDSDFHAGNLINDAHRAALAIEKGLTLASADNDFRRFSGVRLVNPVLNAAQSPRKTR